MIFNTKQEKAKKFNYIPRFYDKKKEDVRHEKMKQGEEPNVEFRDYLRINLQENVKCGKNLLVGFLFGLDF